MRQSVKWFRKIRVQNKILGLEIVDLLLLILLFLFVFMLSTNLIINLAVVLSAYLFLRVYKRGKSPHWTSSVAGFLARPKTYSMNWEIDSEVFE